MRQRINKYAVRILMLSLLLVMLSLLISYATGDSALSLKDVLFWVATVPIAFFSITILGGISGLGWRTDKSTEATSSQSPKQKLPPGSGAAAKPMKSDISWIIAGLLVWLVSYVI